MSEESQRHGSPENGGQEKGTPLYSQPQPGPGNKIGISEGADLYGDIATAEGYGYVTRGYDAIGGPIRPIADREWPA